jgi:hypothetical protein
VNKLLTHVVMLDSLITAYVQFVTMPIELKKVLSVAIILNANSLKQGVLVCVTKLPQSYWNEMYQNYGCESHTFLLH